MPTNHTLRLLTPADARAYTVLRREMLADSPWAFIRSPEDDPGCNEGNMANRLGDEQKRGYAVVGAFTDDSRLVGVAGVNRMEQLKAAHRAFIWGVYVSTGDRRRGLARRLMTAAIDTARAWPAVPPLPPVSVIALSVSERSAGAQSLYRSLGFVQWGTEPDAVRVPGEAGGYAEHHMSLRL